MVTLAVNCCVCPPYTMALCGVRLMVAGGRGKANVIVAEADCAVSATLVAVITTFCKVGMAGAVYSPVAVMAPMPAGLMDQVTAVLLVLLTTAVNCSACAAAREILDGLTPMVMGGQSVTVAVRDVD